MEMLLSGILAIMVLGFIFLFINCVLIHFMYVGAKYYGYTKMHIHKNRDVKTGHYFVKGETITKDGDTIYEYEYLEVKLIKATSLKFVLRGFIQFLKKEFLIIVSFCIIATFLGYILKQFGVVLK